jgi:large subunit ribosomal protein L10e
MTRKPARMYRKLKGRPYTRRKYMGGVPEPRIANFEVGAKNVKFETSVSLAAEESCQIRHTALESARVSATRTLSAAVGPTAFHLKIRTYPHHVLREHKMATGAGADRVSSGMRRAFGKAVGTAARVKSGQIIMTCYVNKSGVEKAKHALKKAGIKLPTPVRIITE